MTCRDEINFCSVSDEHVSSLLPLFELKTSDPLFDGELSWRNPFSKRDFAPCAAVTLRKAGNHAHAAQDRAATVKRLTPGKPPLQSICPA